MLETAFGDGVRALTSTAFKVNEDNDEDITEVETAAVAHSSADALVTADKEEVEDAVPLPLLLTRVSALEGGDEDLDRGSTSTTFNADEEEEEEDIEEEVDSAFDDAGVIEDIEMTLPH